MTHAPLFAGINGFGVASDWMGWEQPFHCEIDPFCQRVIQYYWPNSIPHYDIRETDFAIYRGQIDVLSGGFPCQPFSAAGQRKGTEDNRHLWPEMLRAIREIAPGYVVGENVYGLVNWSGGLVFEQVQADLEAEGYQVTPVILPACGKDAPHRRDRIWFIAYSNVAEQKNRRRKNIETEGEIRGDYKSDVSGEFFGLGAITDADSSQRPERWMYRERPETAKGHVSPRNARSYERNTWQNFPTQSPVCIGNDGISSLLDGITFPKWRNESIKAAGNAIVPQIAYEIFKVIDQL